MPKCPYTFPHRSRRQMIAYLLDRRTYADNYTPYVFAWNVKAHAVDWERPAGEYELDPAFDAAWRGRLDSGETYGPEYQAFEDARRYIDGDEWSSYPGDDQGDWKFYFAGRQAGWIVLQEWRGWRIGGRGREDLAEWLAELETPTLRAFYRGIRTADSDFTPAKAAENVAYYLNDLRHEWEAEQKAERAERAELDAAAMMEARPDMYRHA